MSNVMAEVTQLILAIATLVASCATAWVTVRRVRPKVEDTHAKVSEVANGQRARIDQLEQVAQAAGVPIPPAPLHPGETASGQI